MAAIPLSAFYERNAPRHWVRFAFCKRDEVLDDACERLARHVSGHGVDRAHAA